MKLAVSSLNQNKVEDVLLTINYVLAGVLLRRAVWVRMVECELAAEEAGGGGSLPAPLLAAPFFLSQLPHLPPHYPDPTVTLPAAAASRTTC